MRAYGKPEFLKKGYARLKSPVERILYVKTPVPIEGQVVSGIQALARQSMIGVNECDGAIAVSKKTATRIPADDISLLLSMENDPNERVQMCLDEIRERHELPVKEEE